MQIKLSKKIGEEDMQIKTLQKDRWGRHAQIKLSKKIGEEDMQIKTLQKDRRGRRANQEDMYLRTDLTS